MRLLQISLLVLALGAAGCTTDAGAPDDGKLTVVSTTSILGDVVGEITQDDAEIIVLIPPGVDPHGFVPSAREAQMLREADLIVANGLGLEESVSDALEAAEADGVPTLHVAELLDPIPAEPETTAERDHAEEDDHGHGGLDPHVWHDPVRMADAASLIADRLADADSGIDEAEWHRRGEDYARVLLDLHEEIQEILAPIPQERRLLVTSHDSFGYFASRYGFEIVGTVVPGQSSLASSSARHFAELAMAIDEQGVPAIFVDTREVDRATAALAAEVGDAVEVVSLNSDALSPDDPDARTYRSMLRTNTQRIADALS